MKSLTEREVIDEYNRYNVLLTTLFKQNVRQDEIQRAGDYTPIDIITLLTHQQFSFMLDKLYDQFKGYSNEEVSVMGHSGLYSDFKIISPFFIIQL